MAYSFPVASGLTEQKCTADVDGTEVDWAASSLCETGRRCLLGAEILSASQHLK